MLLIKARGLPAAELRHKPAHQVVSESAAVGHLDEEAVGSSVECLEMSTVMAMVLLGGLCWLKPETTLAEMGSRAEAVECLGLKPCWEGRVPSYLHDGQEEEPLQYLHSRAEHRGFPAFKIGIMTEFFQIAGISTPATER